MPTRKKGNPMCLITDMEPYKPPWSLWTDGGLLSRNPSPLGGSYCAIHVNPENKMVWTDRGILIPKHLGVEKITNNHTELTAVYRGIRRLPDGWKGEIVSDSECVLAWLQQEGRGMYRTWKNCPPWLQSYVELEQKRILDTDGRLEYRHVEGHQESSLDHRWNCECDRICNEEKQLWFERNPDRHAPKTVRPITDVSKKTRTRSRKRKEAAQDGSKTV